LNELAQLRITIGYADFFLARKTESPSRVAQAESTLRLF